MSLRQMLIRFLFWSTSETSYSIISFIMSLRFAPESCNWFNRRLTTATSFGIIYRWPWLEAFTRSSSASYNCCSLFYQAWLKFYFALFFKTHVLSNITTPQNTENKTNFKPGFNQTRRRVWKELVLNTWITFLTSYLVKYISLSLRPINKPNP